MDETAQQHSHTQIEMTDDTTDTPSFARIPYTPHEFEHEYLHQQFMCEYVEYVLQQGVVHPGFDIRSSDEDYIAEAAVWIDDRELGGTSLDLQDLYFNVQDLPPNQLLEPERKFIRLFEEAFREVRGGEV